MGADPPIIRCELGRESVFPGLGCIGARVGARFGVFLPAVQGALLRRGVFERPGWESNAVSMELVVGCAGVPGLRGSQRRVAPGLRGRAEARRLDRKSTRLNSS